MVYNKKCGCNNNNQTNRCGCNTNNCGCNNNCGCKPTCSQNDLYLFLGKQLYNQLQSIDLPCGHPSLDASICALINGAKLPCGHPSLSDIICQAYNCNKNNNGCRCNR